MPTREPTKHHITFAYCLHQRKGIERASALKPFAHHIAFAQQVAVNTNERGKMIVDEEDL